MQQAVIEAPTLFYRKLVLVLEFGDILLFLVKNSIGNDRLPLDTAEREYVCVDHKTEPLAEEHYGVEGKGNLQIEDSRHTNDVEYGLCCVINAVLFFFEPRLESIAGCRNRLVENDADVEADLVKDKADHHRNHNDLENESKNAVKPVIGLFLLHFFSQCADKFAVIHKNVSFFIKVQAYNSTSVNLCQCYISRIG